MTDIRNRTGRAGRTISDLRRRAGRGERVITLGLDIGSLSTEAVIIDQDSNILSAVVLDTSVNNQISARQAMETALEESGYTADDIAYTVVTGYGRMNFPHADKQITEITCHARGAFLQFPDTKTVLDIGGQDSKAIRINETGDVIKFQMNDKCAAGTGRFLEVAADSLGVKIDSLGDISKHATRKISISSVCTVFAESEIVSFLAVGTSREDIARAVHDSVADKAITLLERVGLEEPLTLTGGVMKNCGVVDSLSKKLGIKMNLPADPQIIGALGAARLAQEKALLEKIEETI